MRNVKNVDRVCVGYDVRDLKRYMGTDGPGDKRAMPQAAVDTVKETINDTNTRQWAARNLFVTLCGSTVPKHMAGTEPPPNVTCTACLGHQ